MTQQTQDIANHIANLLGLGFKGEQLAEKAYEFALAYYIDQSKEGSRVTSAMMAVAAYQAKIAMPEAYRLHDLDRRSR